MFFILEKIQKKGEYYEFLLKHPEDGYMILTEKNFSEVGAISDIIKNISFFVHLKKRINNTYY